MSMMELRCILGNNQGFEVNMFHFGPIKKMSGLVVLYVKAAYSFEMLCFSKR